MEGLNSYSTYYARAYATNTVGTAYGNQVSFLTSSVTDIDGNVYPAVLIGEQVWMKRNLEVTHYADGTPIPLIEDSTEWDALLETSKAYCWYDNDSSYRKSYGALYTWPAAMNGALSSDTNPSGVQGACPDGWHFPSDSEWKQLEIHLGMSQAEADKDQDLRGTDEGRQTERTRFYTLG